MDDPEGTYAPESPDLSAYHSAPPVPNPNPYLPHHDQYDTDYQQYQGSMQYNVPSYPMAGYNSYHPGNTQAQLDQQLHSSQHAPMPPLEDPLMTRTAPGKQAASTAQPRAPPRPELEMEIKTKFPVARIKRIMQADEDVGKVAQVTPVAVSKALELFMISLVTTAAEEARSSSSKRVTAVHLKRIVEKDKQFDFLCDIMSKVQDAPAPSEKNDEGNEGGDGKKRKGAGKKRRKNSEEF